jgi:hypothetical protein
MKLEGNKEGMLCVLRDACFWFTRVRPRLRCGREFKGKGRLWRGGGGGLDDPNKPVEILKLQLTKIVKLCLKKLRGKSSIF